MKGNTKKEKKKGNTKNQIPSFLLKLYQILENKEYEKIIYWGDTGKYFVVESLSEFSEKVLPKYFKHNNFASFVRQLNMYDFHKNRNSVNENLFYHKLFIKGQKSLLKLIKRKTNANEANHLNLANCNCDSLSLKRNKTDNVVNLIQNVEEISKSYEECERKIQLLNTKNEEISLQNKSIIQEIYKKNDYSKKLETLLYFIVEMFLPKNTLNNIFNTSEEVKYQNMIKQEEDNNNISGERYKTDELNNIFKNNLSEGFFQNIYEKLRENIQKNGQKLHHYPMLLGSENKAPITDNNEKTTTKEEEDKLANKNEFSLDPYIDDTQKISIPNTPLTHYNKDDKIDIKNPSNPSSNNDQSVVNNTFLGKKTSQNNKENNHSNNNINNNNEIFKMSKPSGNNGTNNFNIYNDEEDLQRYLECNEKNDNNKISYDTNFLIDENIFDFNQNNNLNNNINNNNINTNNGHDKEFTERII